MGNTSATQTATARPNFSLHLDLVDLDPYFCDSANQAFQSVLHTFQQRLTFQLTIAAKVGCLLSSLHSSTHETSQPTATCLECQSTSQPCLECRKFASYNGETKHKTSSTNTSSTDTSSTDTSSTDTVLVFGGNSAGIASGNAQKAIAKHLPIQFKEIADTIQHQCQTECKTVASKDHHNMSTAFCLISCIVFPRNACNEQDNCRQVFCQALFEALEFAT